MSRSVKKTISNVEQNRSIVRELIETFTRLDLSRVCELISKDADWWVVGQQSAKRDAVLESFQKLEPGVYSKAEIDILGMIAEGDRVVVEWTLALEFLDGRTYQNEYVWLVTLQDSQVIKLRVYNNMDKLRSFFQIAQPT